jgi:Chemotaxis protein histidine kinase and related kinases
LSRTARIIQGIIDVTGESAAFSIEDSDVMIDYALAQNLNEPLIHLFMHIIKNNIDAPEDRFDRNKVEEANISVSIVEDEDGLVVEMSDDGEGLDAETVKQTIVIL